MISGDYSALGLLIAGNVTVKARLDTLTEQVASGHVADSYGGLGDAAQSALNLRPQLNSLTAQQAQIGTVTGRLDVTQTALARIAAIASSFAAQTVSLNGLNPAAVDTVANSAKLALQQVAALLDTQVGGIYVFAGTDTSNPPVPDPANIASTGFYTQIQTAVAGLSGTADNSASITAATQATAASDAAGTTPFSATIGGVATVQLGSGQQVQVGLLANANTLAVSAGATTTGSYIRDLLRGLATLSSLSSTQTGAPGFANIVSDTRTSLQGVVSAVATETGSLGNIQSSLVATGAAAGAAAIALQKQISSVEDVDVASVLTELSSVQTQLQASYKLIAASRDLSLVQYL